MASLLQNLDPDKVLEGFGTYGRYQLLTYLMAGISFLIFSYETTVIALVGKPLDECDFNFMPNNTTDSVSYSTIASDFNISCEEKDVLEHANGAFMLGNFINTPLATYLADRYGRRLTFFTGLWLNIICSVACSFAPNYTIFLIFRFLSGLCAAAIAVVGFVLTVESVAGSFRSIQALANSLIWVSGIFGVGILHLFIHDWRFLYLCIVVPGLAGSIVYYYFFPESIHWLIANNRTKGVRRYIIKASLVNKVTLDLHACQTDEINQQNDNDEQHNGNVNGTPSSSCQKQRSFLDLLRHRALFFHLLLNCYIFVVLNFVYWTLTLNSVEMHANKMVGFFLSAAVELPAGLIAMLMLLCFGRRTVTIISLIGQSACLGLSVISPQGSDINLILCLCAKILNSVAWASQPLLLSEMAPTTVRNMFFGFVSTVGELGSVVAPYLERIGDEQRQKMVITAMSMVAILFSMTTPETRNKALPQDLDDFDPGPFFLAINKFPVNKRRANINSP